MYLIKYIAIKLLEVYFILFSFLSGAVIIAHILRHCYDIKIKPFSWMLNYTEDGDYGTMGFIEKLNKEKGMSTLFGLFEIKIGLYSAFLWWWRNPVWTFKHVLAPASGDFEIIKVYINTATKNGEELGAAWWVNKEMRGTNFISFYQGGEYHKRFSHTNNLFNIMIGTGKHRYIFKFRLT